MNSHNKHSSQSAISLHALRGKSWSYYSKHITNMLETEYDYSNTNVLADHRADVQRLDIKDFGLYGISPSDPGPMVLCNQCSHIMAPEGILRHVKRVHGLKIVPAANSKMRIASLLASKGNSTTGSFISGGGGSGSNSQSSTSSLTSAFSNRLNLSRMAPPLHSINSTSDDAIIGYTKSQGTAIVNTTTNSIQPNSSILAATSNSSSSNSNSPTSSTKALISNSSSGSNRRNRKVLPIKYREYDPEKHCGVVIGNIKPCTRSLTCKTHQISLRRNVEGRSKPFDQLLAEHRNNAKDSQQKPLSGKQTNSTIANDSRNQLALESIADSNSSSSFDLERRSFSSNSNQSVTTIGNYNNDHSSVFPPQHQLLNGLQTIPSLTSLSGSSASTTVPLSTVSSNKTHKYQEPVMQNRKSLHGVFVPSPVAPIASIPPSQIHDIANTNATLSVMQTTQAPNSIGGTVQQSNHVPATANLNNLADYSVQMNQLNDLINDDNGDCLDMSFWEDFDNFTYETDILLSNNGQQQQQQSDMKSGVKRSNSHLYENQELLNDRKRKCSNLSSLSSRGIAPRLNKESAKSKEMAINIIAAEIAHSSATYAAKCTTNDDLNNELIPRTDDAKRNLNGPNINADTNSNLTAHNHSSDMRHPDDQQKSATPIQDVICIDDDDDDTNNNLDATVNRNSDKDNVLVRSSTSLTKTTTTTPSNLQFTNTASGSKKSNIANAMAPTPIIPPPLAMMTLSNDPIVNTTDLVNLTKILSENDHHMSSSATPPPNGSNDSKSLQNIQTIPMDENENYLLDIVYKCLRGKGVRMINSMYNNNSNSGGNNGSHRSSSNDSNRSQSSSRISASGTTIISIDREKENSVDHQSDDDGGLLTIQNSATGSFGASSNSNSLLLPPSQRYSTKTHYVGLPKPINTNRFGMARGRGICQFKHAIDSTKKTQQQIYHRLQSQQHNGAALSGSFASAGMIALRNNGSLMRFNSTNLIAANLNSVSNIVNNVNSGNIISSPSSTMTSTSNSNSAGKLTGKKSTHIGNAMNSSSGTGTGIVLINPDTSGTMSSSLATNTNQTHYAILRRPVNQSMQLLASRAAAEPSNSFSVMPVIHRVRTRAMMPTVPKNLQIQTDQLFQKLSKSLRSKMFNSSLLPKKLANQHISGNAIVPINSIQNNSTTSIPTNNSKVIRPQRIHSSPSNYKTTTSSSSSASTKNLKQNGHIHVNNCISVGGIGMNTNTNSHTISNLSRNLTNNSVSNSPSCHRSASSHRSSASLLIGVNQMQTSPPIESLVLPKILS